MFSRHVRIGRKHPGRREFLGKLVAAAVSSVFAERSTMDHLLENDHYRIEFDRNNGAISGLLDRKSGIELISDPRIGNNFTLVVPVSGLEANYIFGAEQELSSFEKTPEGATLRWNGPLSNPQGKWAIDVAMHVTLADGQATFCLEVENGTEYELAEVWTPMLGGLQGIGERADTKVMIPSRGWSIYDDLFVHFPTVVHFGGFHYPSFSLKYPWEVPMPWFDLYNSKLNRGVYVGLHDPSSRVKLLHMSMQPGIATNRTSSNWPREEEVDTDTPVGVTANWIMMPYTGKGVFRAPPVVIQFHEGQWHAGARIFREWFQSNVPVADVRRGWLHQETAFQLTCLMTPEGHVWLRYEDIPRWAQDALDYGVTTIALVGWNRGGVDGWYPYYEPDPKLGSWEDLRRAVEVCHGMGLRVLAMANIQPVDCATDWYERELHEYRCMSKHGHSRIFSYGESTVTAMRGYTARPLIDVNAGFPEFRNHIVSQMVKLAEAGFDGLHLDKVDDPPVDFNPALDASPDRGASEGTIAAVREVFDACQQVNSDFDISLECRWDHMLPHSAVSWSWHSHLLRGNEHTNCLKYAFPQWTPVMAIDTPYVFGHVNTAVRFGYQLLIGPDYYSGRSMKAPRWQRIARYIQEVERIRRDLKDTIYLSEFLDTLEVEIDAPQDVYYNTHRNPKTGQRACIVSNYGSDLAQVVVNAFQGARRGSVLFYQPFKQVATVSLPFSVQLMPEGLVVIVEN